MGLLYQSSTQTQYDFNEITGIANTSGNRCFLVALTDAQIVLLLAALKTAEFPTRWSNGDYDTIDAFVSETEFCLMSGCNVDQLIDTQRLIVAALIGQSVDLSTELPTTADFTTNGIGPRIDALKASLDALTAIVEASDAYADDVEEILDAINVVLGGSAILP